VDAAIGRAGAGGNDGQGLGSEPVDPFRGEDGLSGARVGSYRRPVAFSLHLLVGNRSFDDEDEGVELSLRRVVVVPHEPIADLVGQDRVVEEHLGDAGEGAQHQVLDAGLRGGGDGDRVAVTAQPGGDPDDM
jgi:hypothetical protein